MLLLNQKEFYHYLKQAMEYIHNAEHKFNDLIHLETGSIRIGISTTLTKQLLLPILEKFHNQYPNSYQKVPPNLRLKSEKFPLHELYNS